MKTNETIAQHDDEENEVSRVGPSVPDPTTGSTAQTANGVSQEASGPTAEAIEVEAKRLSELIDQARGYLTEAAIVDEFIAAFPPPDPDEYLGRTRVQIGVGSHCLKGVLLMWDAKRLSDVTPRLTWLANRLGKFTIEDFAEIGRRTYDFGRVKFSVFFNSYSDASVCKFVEVGKKEEPIYKLMCEETVQS